MASIDQLRASDGSGNAQVATVQSSRAPLSSTIVVDTVDGINDTFMGSMGTPHTFTDPITSETITVISEATAVDFSGHVDGSNLEIDDIAPGYTDLGSDIGDIIVIRPTTQYGDNLADVLDVAHRDDGAPNFATVFDANDNESLKLGSVGAAVNEITLQNAAANGAAQVQATGDDTNIDLKLVPKGNGAVRLPFNFANRAIIYTGSGDPFSTTSSSFVDVTGLTQPAINFPTAGAAMAIGSIYLGQGSATSQDIDFKVIMDSTDPTYPTIGSSRITSNSATNNNKQSVAIMFFFATVTAGSHTFKLQVKTSGGTMALSQARCNIIIIPITS